MNEEKDETTQDATLPVVEEKVPADADETSRPEAVTDEVSAVKDQLLRTLAEFENFKKRIARERETTIQYANERLILDILPILDDLERAMKVAGQIETSDEKIRQAFQGFDIIYRKMVKILEEKGLRAIQSIGQELDVDLHDALMQVEADGQAPNVIVDEHEKGYLLGEKVIRHAKVIVSK